MRKAEGTNKLNVAGYDERELEKVLRRNQREMNGEGEMEEEEQPKEPTYFQGKAVTLSNNGADSKVQYDPTGGISDPQMLQVMQLSMQDVRDSW